MQTRDLNSEQVVEDELRNQAQEWIESIQRGAYDYLSKPADKKELQRILENALERTKIF